MKPIKRSTYKGDFVEFERSGPVGTFTIKDQYGETLAEIVMADDEAVALAHQIIREAS